MLKRLELAYEGRHGANGTPLTRQDILDIVETFTPDDVPVTIGHQWSDSAPAYGRIKSVFAQEKEGKLYLIGDIEILDELKEYWDLGIYNRWSIGIAKNAEGKTYLHHLALLGAVPPKIKGLKELQVQYSDELIEIEFAESPKYKSFAKTGYPIADPNTSWDADKAKKRIVEQYGWAKLKECVGAVDVSKENTPRSYSAYKFPYCDIVDGKIHIIPKAVSSGLAYLNGARGVSVDSSLAKVVKPVFEKLKQRIDKSKNFSDGGFNMEEKIKELEEKLKKAQEELSKMQEKAQFADEVKKQMEEYKRQIKQQKLKQLKEAVSGKIPKEKVELLVEFAEKIEDPQVFEFSDKKQRDVIDVLIDVLSALPKPVKEGETQFSDEKEPINLTQEIVKNF